MTPSSPKLANPRPRTPSHDGALQQPFANMSLTESSSHSTPGKSPHVRGRSQSSTRGYGHAQRPSITDSLRGMPPPPSPRQLNQTQSQMLDFLNHPPTAGHLDPRFQGRNWQNIEVGELILQQTVCTRHSSDTSGVGSVQIVDLDFDVESATELLLQSESSVLLVQDASSSGQCIATTFDYRDLTRYLLFATGQLHPETPEQLKHFQIMADAVQARRKVPLRDAKRLGGHEEVVTLPEGASLMAAVELFGGGVHRIIILVKGGHEVRGVLSQSQLLKFLWEQGPTFPTIERLYNRELCSLALGSTTPISVNGDRPLREALSLMSSEGVSSLAVVDHQTNVVGNISNTDVKLLTKSSSAPLLENTCIHFVSIVLSTRGMIDGKDSFPVFYVNPQSTLAHTIAKLVATESHRMWIVEGSMPPTPIVSSATFSSLPPSSSHVPPTPQTSPVATATKTHQLDRSINQTLSSPSVSPVSIAQPSVPHPPHLTTAMPQANPPFMPLSASPTVSASAFPGQHISGRLTGVVSQTDILNLFAKASGLHPEDVDEARRRRRGSSTSSGVDVSFPSRR